MTKLPDYAALFDASPYPYLLIAPDMTLMDANRAYLNATGATRDGIVGKHIFDAFPADPSDPMSTNLEEVRKSIAIAIATGRPHTSSLLRYAVPRQLPGETVFDHRIWSAVHTPVMDAAGDVQFVAQTAINVTDLYRFDASTKRYILNPTVTTVPDVEERSRPELHEALTRILNAERTQLQTIFDQAPGFIAVFDHPGLQFVMVNNAFHELVGERELLGKYVAAALPEVAGTNIAGALTDVVASGRSIVLRNQNLALRREHDGPVVDRYIDLVLQPIIDADGKISAIVAQGHDVTGTHLATLALKDKVRQLEAAKARQAMLLGLGERLRSLADDADAMMVAASEALATFLGVPRAGYVAFDEHSEQALVMNTYSDLGRVPPLPTVVRQPDDYGKAVMDALRSGHAIVVHDMDTDGRTAGPVARAHAAIGARASLAVPIQRLGRSLAFMFAHDVQPRAWSDDDVELMQQTADRTWEAVQRAHALASLRDADRRKDEFLAMLAHELRNPLAPIGAAVQLLQFVRLDENRLRQTSEIIGRQVRHMTGLIDDLLDVSRVTSGLISLESRRLDMHDVIADAIEQVAPLVSARRQTLVLRPAPQPLWVEGDYKRLVQVLGNILNNAVKYTQEGGHIAVAEDVGGEHVTITVTDDGIGMTAELVMRVFDLFAQAERTSDRSSGGLGLGLALVKNLVELHKGTVSCASPGLGMGSTFRVCLPCAPVVAALQADPPAEHAAREGGQALRVLVVDDNVDAANMLSTLLEVMGHDVMVEYSARQGLARARASAPDVCLLDIGLPDMDGNALARQLHTLPETKNAMLVAVTGYGQQHDREGTSAAGFDHHLVKPIDMAQLTAILADASAALRG